MVIEIRNKEGVIVGTQTKVEVLHQGFDIVIVGTQTKVEVLHQGFDIVIVKHFNGKQQCMKCSEVGLKNRTRPKVFRY